MRPRASRRLAWTRAFFSSRRRSSNFRSNKFVFTNCSRTTFKLVSVLNSSRPRRCLPSVSTLLRSPCLFLPSLSSTGSNKTLSIKIERCNLPLPFPRIASSHLLRPLSLLLLLCPLAFPSPPRTYLVKSPCRGLLLAQRFDGHRMLHHCRKSLPSTAHLPKSQLWMGTPRR